MFYFHWKRSLLNHDVSPLDTLHGGCNMIFMRRWTYPLVVTYVALITTQLMLDRPIVWHIVCTLTPTVRVCVLSPHMRELCWCPTMNHLSKKYLKHRQYNFNLYKETLIDTQHMEMREALLPDKMCVQIAEQTWNKSLPCDLSGQGNHHPSCLDEAQKGMGLSQPPSSRFYNNKYSNMYTAYSSVVDIHLNILQTFS